MFQHGIGKRAGEMIIGKGRVTRVRFDEQAILAVSLRLVDRRVPGIEANVNGTVEGQRREVAVAATHVQDRRGQVEFLVETGFDRAQKAAEVGQAAEVKEEKIFRVTSGG